MQHRADVKEFRRNRRREERLRAITRTGVRARGLAPEETLAVGLDLISFAEKLHDAAATPHVRGRRQGD